jgi:hypothetical protein
MRQYLTPTPTLCTLRHFEHQLLLSHASFLYFNLSLYTRHFHMRHFPDSTTGLPLGVRSEGPGEPQRYRVTPEMDPFYRGGPASKTVSFLGDERFADTDPRPERKPNSYNCDKPPPPVTPTQDKYFGTPHPSSGDLVPIPAKNYKYLQLQVFVTRTFYFCATFYLYSLVGRFFAIILSQFLKST